MTLAALIADFLEYLELERDASQLTIRNYNHYLKRFLEFTGDIEPSSINLALTRRYKLHLSKKPLKKITQNYFLIGLRSFLRYLANVHIKTLSPEKVALKDQEPRPLKILQYTELWQILDKPDTAKKQGLRDRAILDTLLSSGLPVSELVSLNRGEFTSVWMEKYLQARRDHFKPLFIRFQGRINPANQGESMRLTPRSIQRIVEKYVKLAAIPVKATPQTIRFYHLSRIDN